MRIWGSILTDRGGCDQTQNRELCGDQPYAPGLLELDGLYLSFRILRHGRFPLDALGKAGVQQTSLHSITPDIFGNAETGIIRDYCLNGEPERSRVGSACFRSS